MKPEMIKETNPAHASVFVEAVKYSIPVLLGYIAIGIAFGLVLTDSGYPWWLATVMSFVMFAGAGQFIAVGLFAAGTSLWEVVLVQFVLNARHIAYGFSMLNRFAHTGMAKFYMIFSLTDENFALLSSLPEDNSPGRRKFMLMVAALNHFYWVAGSTLGAVIGSIIPFKTEGIGFALTALFVVLLIEQILRVRKPWIFLVSAAAAVFAVILLPSRFSLLAALCLALGISSFFVKRTNGSLS
jgi:4-azaleucine resistance transporter AzlC